MRGILRGLCCVLMTAAVTGCGGAFEAVPAGGSVQFNGAPVTSGSITLVPVAAVGHSAPGRDVGKPAKAELNADGTFELSTYDQFDGAVPGRHQVIYEGPEAEEAGEEEVVAEGDSETADRGARRARQTARPKVALRVKEGTEVEVQAGAENRFVIELVEGPVMEEEPVE